ncbi:sulfhydryl oxidase 2 [Synchiropus picturatus]
MFRYWLGTAVLLGLAGGCESSAARLYTEEDPLVILSSRNVRTSLINSSSAWLVQFYSSWCGHCIHYSSTWKALADDVKEWQPVIQVAVLDCALEENVDVCKEFGIKYYPTFKYFRAHLPETEHGIIYRGADREVQSVRRLMVNFLQNHTSLDRPKNFPPMDPSSSVELLPHVGQKSDHYIAIIVEDPESYTGREVILDLLHYSGVQVRRALSSDRRLLATLNITSVPSVYLLHPNGSHAHLRSPKPFRFFFSSSLRSLPGVHRRSALSLARSQTMAPGQEVSPEPWRDFDKSTVYLADLDSGLHYLLRVEMATHQSLEGAELQVFKDFVTLVAKLYPGGGAVAKLMETLSDWLLSLPLQRIPYQAVLDLVNNKMRISGVFLGADLRWVGCQGSRPGLRGYPCSLWTLFHVLTVQNDVNPAALDNTGLDGEAAPVLQVMRRYVHSFFGCRECARHFESAADSMSTIKNKEDQMLWLWRQHNLVNTRLAGSLSDDPSFPKAPWPSTALCPSCHEEKEGVHKWNLEQVLSFLRRHYGVSNLSHRYSLTPPSLPDSHPDPVRVQLEQPGARDVTASLEGKGQPRPAASLRKEREGRGLELGRGGGVWILGFTSVDLSLCVLLYASSCLVIVLLFFFFRVRSRRWKRPRLPV